MDCDRIRGLLSDYLEEELPEGDRAAVAAHLGECPRCTAELAALAETIALLSALPREKAPPELLHRVMSRIERENAGSRGWRGAFSRVKLPVEAAAAVFLVVLVYGIQREISVRTALPGGAGGARREAAVPAPDARAALPDAPRRAVRPGDERPAAARRERAARPVEDRVSPAAPIAEPARETSLAKKESAEARDAAPSHADGMARSLEAAAPRGRAALVPLGAPASPEPPAPPAAPALPGATILPAAAAVPVSSGDVTIEAKMFSAPPSRVLRPVPYGREVTLEVTSAERAGLEEKIVAAAQRLGGGLDPGAAPRAEAAQPHVAGAVRVLLPAGHADAFLDALKDLGTIPTEGMPAAADLPAGPSPGVAAYTVRIRVR